MRKAYLDTIRRGTILLVMAYHVFYLYNTVGVPAAIPGGVGIPALDAPLYFVYPWFMVLLFVIAGISSRYSLQKRTVRQFLGERATKLIVPSTLGLFIYQWIGGYLNIKMGGGLETMPKFLVYPISAFSGTGPLWFAEALFLFSLLLAILHKADKRDVLWKLGKKANIVVVLLFVFPLWGASALFNMPLITVFRFGIYGMAFLLGYFVFSHTTAQELLKKYHIVLLIAAVILGICYTIHYFGRDYTAPDCLQSFFTNAYAWVAVLAIIGCGQAWQRTPGKFSAYMTNASFGLYVLHYPITLASCYLLYYYCHLPMVLNYILALIATFTVTPLLYELFKRIPIVRYCVLGIRKK